MLRRAASVALALALVTVAVLLISPSVTPPVAPPAEAQGPYKFTGTSSCGSSKCHGDTKPRAEYPKMNENIIWTQKDKHAKAYATLTNEKLKSGVSPSKIAKNMNIAKAETSDRCLVCHAVNAKPDQRGPKFDITAGVHCEGCHGPAEKWLEPHAEKGWTHEKSVAVGMYDTRNLLLRAEKCVSCHLHIEAEMVAAGHPDLLAFELDTFSQEMSKPPHYRDRGQWMPARAWALGQLVALREAAKQLGDRAKGNAAAKLLQDAGGKVAGHGAVVKHALGALLPDAQKAVEADIAAAVDAVKKGDKAAMQAASAKIVTAMNQQAPKVGELNQASVQKLVKSIAGDADAIGAGGVRSAEQAAMALDRLSANYWKAAPAGKDAGGKVLDKVFATIEDPAKYDAKEFAAQVKAFDKEFK